MALLFISLSFSPLTPAIRIIMEAEGELVKRDYCNCKERNEIYVNEEFDHAIRI